MPEVSNTHMSIIQDSKKLIAVFYLSCLTTNDSSFQEGMLNEILKLKETFKSLTSEF